MGPTCPWGNPEDDGIVILVVPSLLTLLDFLNIFAWPKAKIVPMEGLKAKTLRSYPVSSQRTFRPTEGGFTLA
jgi:hypothetical protein